MTSRILSAAAVLLLPAVTARAQEPKEKPQADDRAARLLKECVDQMARLSAVEIHTKETQKNAMVRGVGDNTSRTTAKAVVSRDQGMTVSINDGEHEIVRAAGRTAVRAADGDWCLRRDCLSEGEPMPFVPDLFALWAGLRAAAATATLGEPGTVGGTPVEVVSLAIGGEKARDLMWSGALPAPSSGLGGIVMLGMGGKIRPPTPAINYEIDLAINPSTRLIEEIQVRGRRKDGQGGNMIVRVGGAGFGEEEEEPEEEEGAGGKKKALEEAPDKKNPMRYTLTFKGHGKATLEIPEGARKLLLPAAEGTPARR